MTILVTGAGGQVGRELVMRNRPGLAVAGLDRTQLDITDAKAVADALAHHQATALVNAAAYTAVDKAESDSAAAFASNRDAVEGLGRACASAGIPLFHLSTDYVFDGGKAGAYTEDDAPNPTGVYGKSKLAGEQVLRAAHAQHLILRVSWVFGAHGNNFVRTMIRLGRERQTLRVVADQFGGPTPASAIADTLLELAGTYLRTGSLAWGTYHYAGSPVVSWHAFAQAIFEEASGLGLTNHIPDVAAIPSTEYPTPAQRPANSALDMTRGRTLLGLSPPEWRSALRDVLNTWKNS
ncbi:dTDP-4-dehydrorhamnose reductase [Pigmentiphaga humi]|uniref:dTDP-4-dehydrorhamnose reductase n=1 Tax=Pigmentiphaga humi TaxID=2478468 RepID=A0A3P4B1D0_9BURK|nr:dTDP-4-dehydrorhamnose reductase [Pigmentiphaga humi]VCU70097.1 dTDP-4-dehydrorhamnose reductase [Pigmentiphaga humi]